MSENFSNKFDRTISASDQPYQPVHLIKVIIHVQSCPSVYHRSSIYPSSSEVCLKCFGYKSLFCVISCCFIHFSAFMAFGLASPWPLFSSGACTEPLQPTSFSHSPNLQCGTLGRSSATASWAMSIAICRAGCRCGAKAPGAVRWASENQLPPKYHKMGKGCKG